MAEEFHHPQYLFVDHDGKGKGAMEIRLSCERGTWEVGVLHHIKDPGWLAGRPNPPRQAKAIGEVVLHGHT